MDQAENAQCRVGQRGKGFGQPRPLGVMAIFIPPAVFDEVEAVFHLPVVANIRLQASGRDGARIKAGREIAALCREHLTRRRTYFTINAEGNLTTGEVQTLADIGGVVQVDPQPAGFARKPLFSVASWAGRDEDACAKQVFKASSTSGWLSLIWNR